MKSMGDSVSQLTCDECGEPIVWRHDVVVVMRPPKDLSPLHAKCHMDICDRGLIQKLSNKPLNGDHGARMLRTYKWVNVILAIWVIIVFIGTIALFFAFEAGISQFIFLLFTATSIPLIIYLFFRYLRNQMKSFVDESWTRFESQLPERKP